MKHHLKTRGTALSILLILTGLIGLIPSHVQSVSKDSPAPGKNSDAISADWLGKTLGAISDMEYNITPQKKNLQSGENEGYQAPNRAQNFRTYFNPLGIRIVSRTEMSPSWNFSWNVIGISRSPKISIPDNALISQSQNRLVYKRHEFTVEYENSREGLRQIFTIQKSPAGSGSLIISSAWGKDIAFSITGQKGPVRFSHEDKDVLNYCIVSATDANGNTLPFQLDAAREQVIISINDAGAISPLTVESIFKGKGAGLLPDIEDWYKESNQTDAKMGYSVGTAGDVNGDGYSDVIIGVPEYDDGTMNQGRVYVFHGSIHGLSNTPNWYKNGDLNGRFGFSVSTAGDVNGDGYCDVIIGAPYLWTDFEASGGIYIYHGSSDGLSAEDNFSYKSDSALEQFGWSVSTAGDVNGDGYSDVIAGAPFHWNDNKSVGRAHLFYGSSEGVTNEDIWTATGTESQEKLGYCVSTAGDVNGDGYSDIIIGSPYRDTSALTDNGVAFVVHGSSAGPGDPGTNWTMEGDKSYASLGFSVSTAGDVNGDGYADVIIGAPYREHTIGGQGAAYVYHGSSSSLSTIANSISYGEEGGGHLGWSVATAGDVNGDGYGDIIIGQKDYDGVIDEQGCVYVWLGGAEGLGGSLINGKADWIGTGGVDYAEFGGSVKTAGDVNGDGYSDVIIGAPGYSNGMTGEGRVFVYHGGSVNLSQDPGWEYLGGYKGMNLGHSVNSAGDVNGDGFADIIVGAPYYEGNYTDEGAIFVWYGSALGPGGGIWTSVDWWAKGDAEGAHLGYSVSTAGDVNGDGYCDILAGMPGRNNSTGNEGAAVLWYGSSSGIEGSSPSTPGASNWTAEGTDAGAEWGFSVSTVGDVNGDGYSDIIIGAPYYSNGQTGEGIVYAWYGSASGLGETGSNINADFKREGEAENAKLGICVATAGDVNRDGFSDAIAGGNGFAAAWYGHLSGLPSSGNSWLHSGYLVLDGYGSSVSTAGDVDGDGYSDVIVGAPLYDNISGSAWIYKGGVGGLGASASWTDTGLSASAFGYSVGTAGDLNGDGFADVIIGAPLYSDASENKGEVRVYYGSDLGPVSNNGGDWVRQNDVGGTKLGYSVACAGDVNGDGFADILIGSPIFTNTKLTEGRASLFYGDGAMGVSFNPRQMCSAADIPIAPLGKSDAAHSFYLELTGKTPTGKGKVKFYYEAKALRDLFDGSGMEDSAWKNTGVSGVKLTTTVVSLNANSHYHWRVRIRYHPVTNPFNPPFGRWIHMPWTGWNESDLRTGILPIISAEDIIEYLLGKAGYQTGMDHNQDGITDISDVIDANIIP
jgi:hypothetical protein